MQELLQRMRTTRLFGHLSAEQLTSLVESSEMRSAVAGEILAKPDEQLRDHMVLIEGELEVQRIWTVPGGEDKRYTFTPTPKDAEEGAEAQP